jgi:hypothetical protein
MSDLPFKIDKLYQKGLISKDEWRTLVDCMFVVDGIAYSLPGGEDPELLREIVDEALLTLLNKIETLNRDISLKAPAGSIADSTAQGYRKLAWENMGKT